MNYFPINHLNPGIGVTAVNHSYSNINHNGQETNFKSLMSKPYSFNSNHLNSTSTYNNVSSSGNDNFNSNISLIIPSATLNCPGSDNIYNFPSYTNIFNSNNINPISSYNKAIVNSLGSKYFNNQQKLFEWSTIK